MDRTKIKPQDVTSVLSNIASNPAGSNFAWRHLQLNWKDLVDKFGAGSFTMGHIIENVISHFSTEFDYEQVMDKRASNYAIIFPLLQVEAFFKPRKQEVGSGMRALEQSMEQIRVNIRWRQTSEESIRTWFKDKVGEQKLF